MKKLKMQMCDRLSDIKIGEFFYTVNPDAIGYLVFVKESRRSFEFINKFKTSEEARIYILLHQKQAFHISSQDLCEETRLNLTGLCQIILIVIGIILGVIATNLIMNKEIKDIKNEKYRK